MSQKGLPNLITRLQVAANTADQMTLGGGPLPDTNLYREAEEALRKAYLLLRHFTVLQGTYDGSVEHWNALTWLAIHRD